MRFPISNCRVGRTGGNWWTDGGKRQPYVRPQHTAIRYTVKELQLGLQSFTGPTMLRRW